jgi:aldose 1-epimerase
MHTVTLRNEFLSAEILPEIGGALARLDYFAGGAAPVPVLRPFTLAGSLPRPNQLACFPLVPWSNRLAGGFTCDGRSYSIAPNREGDPYPIHGEGWLRPWQIDEQSLTRLALALDRRDGAPFSYQAKLEYTLCGAGIEVMLEVTNSGSCALPFGLGLHPWMPRSEQTTLRAHAREVWLSGADRLPAAPVPIPAPWRFDEPRALPGTPIDNVFGGWDGRAEIAWPDRGIKLRIASDATCYIVYAPEGADFFCFEPVDHLINAHNLPGGPERNGLTMLAPGQWLRRRFRFTVQPWDQT